MAPVTPRLAPDHHDPLNTLGRRHVADGERNATGCDKRVQQAGDESAVELNDDQRRGSIHEP